MVKRSLFSLKKSIVNPFHIATLVKERGTYHLIVMLKGPPLSPVNENVSTVLVNNPLIDNVFKSKVLSGLSSLKSVLAELKSNLRLVKQTHAEFCNLQWN